MAPLKAFISYSHADEKHKNDLAKFLVMLKRNGVLESWDDRQLLAGDKLDVEIERKLLEADLIILLVSQDFISSYYCYEIELQKAFEKANNDSGRIVAIIVDHCTWAETPMKDFVLLPQDAKPVVGFNNPNEAWLAVSKAIGEVCKDVKKKELTPADEGVLESGGITSAFKEYLNLNEIILQHRSKDEVGLDDIYVAPDLKLIDVDPDKFDLIITSAKITNPFLCPRRVVIAGDEQSGKTALAKEIFKRHSEAGRIPVWIKGDEIKTANVGEIIEAAALQQYGVNNVSAQTYIVESIEHSKLNAKFLIALIKSICGLDGQVIFISGNGLRFNESTWKEFSDFDKYEILPFGHVLRGELINKWNSLGQEETIDLSELHAANDRVTHHIDAMLRKNIVPPKPVFILMILQTLESNSPSDFSLTAYGHCYNALIQQQLRKSSIKSDQVDKYINYLTELAYYIFSLDASKIEDDELSSFKREYSSRYLIDSHERVISELCKIGLLRSDVSGLYFSYKYIFYFYAAKYIAENYAEQGSDRVRMLCEKMHSERHANVLIFVTYHTKDQRVLDHILSFAEGIFSAEKAATLEAADTEHFEDVLKSIPELAMEIRSAEDVESQRKLSLDQKDKLVSQLDSGADDDDDELIETHTFADINKSAKAVEIIGQILRNRHASLKIDQLTSLSQASFLTGLRFLSFYFKITRSLKSEIVDEISRIIQQQSSMTDGEVTDQARKLFFHFCYAMSFSVIKKISFSVGNDQLIQIFKNIADEIDTPAVHLISMSIQLEFTKKINRDYILEVKRKMDRGSISYRLMQEVILQHLYLHNIDYSDRQWLSAKLDIPMKNQRVVQNKKQAKILSS
jgi:hypothetical protein